jgi:PKD repeat protein
MKRLLLTIIALILLTAAAGCAAPFVSEWSSGPVPAPSPTQAPAPTIIPGAVPAPVITLPPVASESGGKVTSTPAPAPAPEQVEYGNYAEIDRMIVRTGQMQLVVEDVRISIDNIISLAENIEGYVVSSQSWKEGERLVGSITIRVPAEQFNYALSVLRGMAVEVTNESTSSQDVTEEYVDLSARLSNLEVTEQQLLVLMEKAIKVEDVLNVQRELAGVREEIERIKGRMQYLERTSAMSLISVNLEQSKLEVKFSASKVTVKEGEGIRFDSDVGGGVSPYSYEWDFGDGNTSTESNPVHIYRSAGTYTVVLTVTDDRDSTDIETRADYITVLPGWSAGSIASGAWNGLVGFGRVLANVFIWIGVFSPVWIFIGVVVFLIWWRSKKKANQGG